MSLLNEFGNGPITIFIAYSFVYIESAINALKTASNKVEAIIVQPYRKGIEFVSTREAMRLYREFNGGKDIAILFAPQGRMSEEGQFFEYGGRLLDVFSKEEMAKIE